MSIFKNQQLFLFICISSFFFMETTPLVAQGELGYQTPPKAIADLIEAPLTPGVSISPDHEWMLFLDRPSLPSIEEVAQEELRIGGIRINPKTNGSSRASYYSGIKVRTMDPAGKDLMIKGLPESPRIQNLSWSPNSRYIAFTITRANGLELWIADLTTASAKQYTDAIINDAMGGLPYTWLSDGKTLLYKAIPEGRGEAPEESTAPSGPVIQENTGKTAAVRTYQDLLKNPYDEELFEYYTRSQLFMLDVTSGDRSNFGPPGILSGYSPSPDGNYVMIWTVRKPFSYIVPYSRFPFTVEIYGREGRLVRQIADIPAAENIPVGFGSVRMGPRSFSWRADAPATLYWVEAQDGGDPKAKAAIRDKMYFLKAPFKGQAQEGISFQLRYGGVTWGSGDLAVADEWQWSDRRLITSFWQPDNPAAGKRTIFDRSWEDSYNDPGDFERTLNKYGRSVLQTGNSGRSLYLTGTGASPEGNRPFIDVMDIKSLKTNRLWRSEAPYFEYPITITNAEKGIVITRRESKEEPPNYFMRDLKNESIRSLTTFPNPYESMKDVDRQMIRYQREDGVEVTGTLYLPPGYDKKKDGRLPVFMWAYPREYKSADAAAQVTDSPYEFTRLYWGSPIYWVMHGYAVFDDFGMPIIGEGDEEPNENFVEQLRLSAEAAINKLVDIGVADRNRIAVGGHSYGAFMTANLLAHTELFAAGIARSGAYNRTLTPFGFQSEERTFWQAPEIYFKMSPFMHADQVKSPLLLIHGEADNNSGTFPMQSERYYAALKGHGATVRLVMLPHESHGYRARESVLHMMWEMTEWMDKYVKNRKEE
jgi:dipeptidyl aminopeptidase/acylaminoacyl peptidase